MNGHIRHVAIFSACFVAAGCAGQTDGLPRPVPGNELVLVGEVEALDFKPVSNVHGVRYFWPIYRFKITHIPLLFQRSYRTGRPAQVKFYVPGTIQDDETASDKIAEFRGSHCPDRKQSGRQAMIFLKLSDQLKADGVGYEMQSCAYIDPTTAIGLVRY